MAFRNPAVVIVAAGALLRVVCFVLLAPAELDPDAGNYLSLARAFDWSEPWAASNREPLFIGVTKLFAAPFGYSPLAPRVMTLIASIGVVGASLVYFRKVMTPTTATLAGALVAGNMLLVFLAPRGLREELALLLIMLVAVTLVGNATVVAKGLIAAVLIGALSGVRWEMAAFTLLAIGAVSVWRSWLRPTALFSVAAIAIVSGPWMVANSSRYDDPFYHSVYSATWFRDREFDPPGTEDQYFLNGPEITWSEYYLDFLGPAEAARRTLIGFPSLAVDGTYQWFLPISGRRFGELLPMASGLYPFLHAMSMAVAVVTLVVCAVGSFVGWRRREIQIALAVTVFGWLIYAPVERFLIGNYRLISFTVPFQAMLLAAGAVHLYKSSWIRRRTST